MPKNSYHKELMTCFEVCRLIDTDFIGFLREASRIKWGSRIRSVREQCILAALHMGDGLKITVTWTGVVGTISNDSEPFTCTELLDLIEKVHKFGWAQSEIHCIGRTSRGWKDRCLEPITFREHSVHMDLYDLTHTIDLESLQLRNLDETGKQLVLKSLYFLKQVLIEG